MTTEDSIRKLFTDFFIAKNHQYVPSSSLVPKDSTLLFTNSGMVQFKDYFTNTLQPPFNKAVTVQKCVRAGGKHNDLENVGYTNRHHTFFEMLGNFSFGDYFKEEAIAYAWEFLTKEVNLNAEKLYVTVYHTDDEARNVWKKFVPESKIISISTNDNFWQAGNTGPCGPCSEIFYDYGNSVEGGLPGSKNEDGARFTEIWNLVFMQNFIGENGKITELSSKNIDTGMGLERLASVLEGTVDNYCTPSFRELIEGISHITKIKPSKNLFSPNGNINLLSKDDISLRILTDHIRSICFLMADGVLPSNEGSGYVLRRIIRRALKEGYFSGTKGLFLQQIAEILILQMKHQYPELQYAKNVILTQLELEEIKFSDLLPRGVRIIKDEIHSNTKNNVLNGNFAFKLYDTYGFPVDLTLEIAKDYGVQKIDEEGFQEEMQIQKTRSKKSWKNEEEGAFDQVKDLISKLPKTKFLGYNSLRCRGKVLFCRNKYAVFNQTVFYAESGGQISDIGSAGVVDVIDVQNIDGVFVHLLAENLMPHMEVDLNVQKKRRKQISSNHTATHILHQALREKFGEGIAQKGSLVKDDEFRFDFSHQKPLTFKEIQEIEHRVNEIIMQNHCATVQEFTKEEAFENGAIGLFGEKYDSKVRTIKAGESFELCGGTHVGATGEIGFFKIISQSAVASGIRRIEAKTGFGLLEHLHNFENEIHNIKQSFKTSSSISELLHQKDDETKKLKKEIEKLQQNLVHFIPIKQVRFGEFSLHFKVLNNYGGEISSITKNMEHENNCTVNQKDGSFSFCIYGKNAKEIALEIQKSYNIKFGGNSNFVNGGGSGDLKF